MLSALALLLLAATAWGQDASPTNPAPGLEPAEGDYTVHDFTFKSGETLGELRLHYTTHQPDHLLPGSASEQLPLAFEPTTLAQRLARLPGARHAAVLRMQRAQVQRGAVDRDPGGDNALAELGEQLVVAGEKPTLPDQPSR